MKSGMNVLYRHVYSTVDGDAAGRSTKYDYSLDWEKIAILSPPVCEGRTEERRITYSKGLQAFEIDLASAPI